MQHGDLHAAAEGGGHRGGEGIGGDVRLELLGHGDGAESLAYDELHVEALLSDGGDLHVTGGEGAVAMELLQLREHRGLHRGGGGEAAAAIRAGDHPELE